MPSLSPAQVKATPTMTIVKSGQFQANLGPKAIPPLLVPVLD